VPDQSSYSSCRRNHEVAELRIDIEVYFAGFRGGNARHRPADLIGRAACTQRLGTTRTLPISAHNAAGPELLGCAARNFYRRPSCTIPSLSIREPYNDLVIRLFFCLLSATVLLPAQAPASFDVVEATISQVHDAMKAGRLTCRELVGHYLKRIEAYDKNGPGINSIVMVNPEVEKQAE
jgi:hypothetical protein